MKITGHLYEMGLLEIQAELYGVRINRTGAPDLVIVGMTREEVRELAPDLYTDIDISIAEGKVTA